MRLADFILRDMESILVQFEEFAGSLLPAAQQLDPDELRDDAQQILEAKRKICRRFRRGRSKPKSPEA